MKHCLLIILTPLEVLVKLRQFYGWHLLLTGLTALVFFIFGGCSTPVQDRAKLKEEIKQEILAELRQQKPADIEISQQSREQMEREILAKVQSQFKNTLRLSDANNRTVQWRQTPVGSAEGRILYDGVGLAGCRVKLVRILKSQSITEMLNVVKEGTEFTAVTDEDGKYHFDRIPVGSYKLKWQLPRDKGWIRRLQDRPDAVITEGQRIVLKPVETKRRLAPG